MSRETFRQTTIQPVNGATVTNPQTTVSRFTRPITGGRGESSNTILVDQRPEFIYSGWRLSRCVPTQGNRRWALNGVLRFGPLYRRRIRNNLLCVSLHQDLETARFSSLNSLSMATLISS